MQVVPTRWYAWDATLLEDGRPLTTLDLARIRDRARFTLGGADYEIRSEGFLQGRFRLERDGRVLATAERSGFLRRRFEVSAGDRQLTLRARFPLRRYQLLHGDRVVGQLAREGWLTRRARAELPSDIAPPIRVFLVFLALVQWRRAARAAAGS